MKINGTVHTTTTKKFEMAISGQDIIKLLQGVGYDIPDGAQIEFHVPGGADWSNTAIDIDLDNPVLIGWQTTEHSDDDTPPQR